MRRKACGVSSSTLVSLHHAVARVHLVCVCSSGPLLFSQRRREALLPLLQLLTAIGQRDRPKTAVSPFAEAAVATEGASRKTKLAALLWSGRVSRSRGAEVVSPNGRKVLQYLA